MNTILLYLSVCIISVTHQPKKKKKIKKKKKKLWCGAARCQKLRPSVAPVDLLPPGYAPNADLAAAGDPKENTL